MIERVGDLWFVTGPGPADAVFVDDVTPGELDRRADLFEARAAAYREVADYLRPMLNDEPPSAPDGPVEWHTESARAVANGEPPLPVPRGGWQYSDCGWQLTPDDPEQVDDPTPWDGWKVPEPTAEQVGNLTAAITDALTRPLTEAEIANPGGCLAPRPLDRSTVVARAPDGAIIEPVMPGSLACGEPGCDETFWTPQKRGAHRRRAHPGGAHTKTRRSMTDRARLHPALDVTGEQVANVNRALAAAGTGAPLVATGGSWTGRPGRRGPDPLPVQRPDIPPRQTPPPAAALAALCRCGHGMRMHERLDAVDDRGGCLHGGCVCSGYHPTG